MRPIVLEGSIDDPVSLHEPFEANQGSPAPNSMPGGAHYEIVTASGRPSSARAVHDLRFDQCVSRFTEVEQARLFEVDLRP